MSLSKPKIRLFVTEPLGSNGIIGLPADQSHYLRHVMRVKTGEEIALFNGKDGEWRARVDGIGKGWASLELQDQIHAQRIESDLWLCFAPIKRTRIDFLIEKATELGVSRLQPVMTQFTNSTRVNLHRLKARSIEAAEQSERLSVPEICEAISLEGLLATWPGDRELLFCDERHGARGLVAVAADQSASDRSGYAILIGPEGGFDDGERQILLDHPATISVSLGPRILRAETAALAALSTWQALTL